MELINDTLKSSRATNSHWQTFLIDIVSPTHCARVNSIALNQLLGSCDFLYTLGQSVYQMV